MVYPLTKKELYCGTTLKHLCSFYGNIVSRTGIEPVLKRFRGVCITTLPTAQINILRQNKNYLKNN